jgi:glucose/arabinose dehydrogenase
LLGVSATPIAAFEQPWSLEILPTGEILVGQRIYGGGKIMLVTPQGSVSTLTAGIPTPNNGVLDIALDPHFSVNNRIFFTFIEVDPNAPRIGRPQDAPNENPEGVAVASATLVLNPAGGGSLADLTIIWRQLPKITTPEISGNFGAKLAFSPDGRYLFVSNGDRQELVPDLIQSEETSIGKVVRIFPDGTIPTDNPFYGQTNVLPEIWTMGHRNPYGLAFDAQGQL